MPLKINYLIPSNKNQIILGRIIFLDSFVLPTIETPYFYLNNENETLNFSNWPYLVPYMYDKKLGFFTTINNIYQYKDNFEISSFSCALDGTLTLKFTDVDSLKALKAIYEDMMIHYLENNSYTTWNRTITPLNNLNIENVTIMFANINYKIDTLQIINDNLISLTVKINYNQKIDERALTDKYIEFGLYRLANKTSKESIFYNGIKGKYFSTSDSINFIPGLRTRSQIIGHTHNHTHNMNNHTHNMSHSHDMSNHSHYMNHNHGYAESRSDMATFGGAGGWFGGAGPQRDTYRTTHGTRAYTDGPHHPWTGSASQTTTTTPSNNITSGILSKTTNKDEVYSNDNNFKIGDKNHYDANTKFAYIYGGIYVP